MTSSRTSSLLLAAFAPVALAAQSSLAELSAIPGPPGAEFAVSAYLLDRLPAKPELDNTGSFTLTFGEGSPRTLIVAGLDEPGFALSGVTDDGYLRLQRLAEPPPSYEFERYFVGQPVEILRRTGGSLPGVIAAPSVHFKNDRSTSGGRTELFVDIGASSREEVAAVGVRILDRVRLDEPVSVFGPDLIAGPWISSRAGAALLRDLAAALADRPPPYQVTVAFVSQQSFHNSGLLRVLRRTDAERVLLVRPGGSEAVSVAPVEGWTSDLRDELLAWAEEAGIELDRGADPRLSFGPFNTSDFWADKSQSAVLTLGPNHSGTPIEILDRAELQQAAAVLAHLAGIDAPGVVSFDDPAGSSAKAGDFAEPWVERLAALVVIPGVSGSERAVRETIRTMLPAHAAGRANVDDKGNLIVRLGSDGDPRAIFIAHMDEIGFKVTRADPSGKLALSPQGGLSDEIFAWHSLRGALLERNGSGWAPPGTVDVGQALTPPKRLRRLLGERINARSLDDRAGCAALLEALHRIGEARAGSPVWVVFSVEEETGLRGAAAIAERVSPRRVYAVDSLVTSDSPLEPPRIAHAKLGDGPALRAQDQSGLTPLAEAARVEALAAEHGIPLQVGVTAGGNDGSKFVPAGAANIPLSFPLRYSHTAAETADLRDLRGLIDLIEVLIEAELSAPQAPP